MNTDKRNEAKEAKREYYREWRKKNPDKVCATQERFWSKKAAELKNQKTSAESGTGGKDD